MHLDDFLFDARCKPCFDATVLKKTRKLRLPQSERHEPLRLQLAQRNLLTRGKPMTQRQRDHSRLAHHHFASNLRIFVRDAEKTHVEPPLLERENLRGGRHLVQRPLYLRMLFAQIP